MSLLLFFKVDTQWKVKGTRQWPGSQEQQDILPSAEFGIEVCQILYGIFSSLGQPWHCFFCFLIRPKLRSLLLCFLNGISLFALRKKPQCCILFRHASFGDAEARSHTLTCGDMFVLMYLTWPLIYTRHVCSQLSQEKQWARGEKACSFQKVTAPEWIATVSPAFVQSRWLLISSNLLAFVLYCWLTILTIRLGSFWRTCVQS